LLDGMAEEMEWQETESVVWRQNCKTGDKIVRLEREKTGDRVIRPETDL
jgi:hypothetical protein